MGDKNKKLPTVLMLVARAAIGAYLVSLGYDLFSGAAGSGNLGPVFTVVSVIFMIFGAGAVILGIKELATGHYAGGPKDTGETVSEEKEVK